MAAKTKSGLDTKFINEIKKSLLEKRLSLMEKLNTWEDKSSPSGLKEMGDIADIASEINEEALNSALTENEIDLLRLIEKALVKIDNGTYGICEGSKKKIPVARLRAIPWTPYTVEYAEIAAKNKAKQIHERRVSESQPYVQALDISYGDD